MRMGLLFEGGDMLDSSDQRMERARKLLVSVSKGCVITRGMMRRYR